MSPLLRHSFLCFAAPLALVACKAPQTDGRAETKAKAESGLDLKFEKITLDNGLDVVFHVDRSDPALHARQKAAQVLRISLNISCSSIQRTSVTAG